jgi:hypothetical protein
MKIQTDSATYTGGWSDRPASLAVPSEGRPDPREVGDLCYSGHRDGAYLVLAIKRDQFGHMTSITVMNLTEPNQLTWDCGTINVQTHSTAWDWDRDAFIDHSVHVVIPEWRYPSYWDFVNEVRDIACNWVNPFTQRTNYGRI